MVAHLVIRHAPVRASLGRAMRFALAASKLRYEI